MTIRILKNVLEPQACEAQKGSPVTLSLSKSPAL